MTFPKLMKYRGKDWKPGTQDYVVAFTSEHEGVVVTAPEGYPAKAGDLKDNLDIDAFVEVVNV